MASVTQTLIEIVRCKLSRSLCLSSSRKIEVYADAIYGTGRKRRLFKSKLMRMHAGIVISVPWDIELVSVVLHFSSIDELASCNLGKAVLDIPDSLDINQVESQVFVMSGNTRVGNVLLRIHKQDLFCNDEVEAAAQFRVQRNILDDDMKMKNPVPKFKFKRLSRPINWDRIRALNMQKYVLCAIYLNEL